jgi:hypothetical protein
MPAPQVTAAVNGGLVATAKGVWGLTGSAAQAVLNKTPITVTPAQAQTMINTAVTTSYAPSAASGYASTTGFSANTFNNLWPAVQDALTEAVFNAGSWSAALAANPGLAAAVQSSNWQAVATALQNNVGGHSAVKNAAAALQKAMANKSVPYNGMSCH